MSMRARPVVAIDGPAGAGKTSVTARVAAELGYLLVGTGALYRAVALAARRTGVSWSDERAVGELARDLTRAGRLRLVAGPEGERVLLEGLDVTVEIRRQEIGGGASQVSAQADVRAALLELQRELGRAGGVVLEGRDIGTCVFPDAEAKFFLTASVEVRAARRHRELVDRGEPSDLLQIEREVRERDARDAGRAISPLRQAADAWLVDSSNMTLDEVVAQIVARVREVEAALQARAGRG